MTNAPKTDGPYPHKIPVATIHGTTKIRLVPDEAARKHIARAFKIRSVDKLVAFFEIVARNDGALMIKGDVSVEAQQNCIVSLEPIPERFVEPVDVVFASAELIEKLTKRAEDNENFDFEPPDELVDGVLDLGALACEFIALGLNPYPRKDGVDFAQAEEDPSELSPFSALKSLGIDQK